MIIVRKHHQTWWGCWWLDHSSQPNQLDFSAPSDLRDARNPLWGSHFFRVACTMMMEPRFPLSIHLHPKRGDHHLQGGSRYVLICGGVQLQSSLYQLTYIHPISTCVFISSVVFRLRGLRANLMTWHVSSEVSPLNQLQSLFPCGMPVGIMGVMNWKLVA